MKYNIFKSCILFICFTIICIWSANLPAGGSRHMPPAHARTTPGFDHTLHEERLGEEEGCGKCHHVMDEKENKLVYEEGEEAACSECHSAEDEDDIPALREANHGSCTDCHREMKKEKKAAGPTTCGECHRE